VETTRLSGLQRPVARLREPSQVAPPAGMWQTWIAACLLAAACGENNGPAETTGLIRVSSATTGALLDPDGYAVGLDGGGGQAIDVDGTLLMRDVAPGNHSLTLTGLACNCRVVEAQPVSVLVTAGDTVDASFTVTCEEVGRLVFVDNPPEAPNSFDIYVVDLDGSDRTRLTHGLDARSPRWSPDGLQIAYVTDGGIGVMNADGTSQDMLTESPEDGAPSWSPDGSRVVFASGRDHPAGEIYTMNADGSGVQRLTIDDEVDEEPAWSPDGNSIAFISSRGELEFGTDIYTMSPDGSAMALVASGGDWDLYTPSWSPDGNQIVYHSSFTLIGGLHILTLDDTPVPYEGPFLVEDGFHPAWSPGGSWIAYALTGIGVIHPDGTGGRQLTSGIQPSWAPPTVVQTPDGGGQNGCEPDE
jgi:WD40 repeat protein